VGHGVDLERGGPVFVFGRPERGLQLGEGGVKDVAGERWVAPDAGIGDEDVQMGFPASDYGGNGEDAVFGTEIAGESRDGSELCGLSL
jgi:hypothetical protein